MEGDLYSGRDFPEEHEHRRVLEDHLMWSEYGAGFDLRDLPSWEFRAHVALLSGIKEREASEAEKAQHTRRR